VDLIYETTMDESGQRVHKNGRFNEKTVRLYGAYRKCVWSE
jgi:hypothetical protein